MALRDDCFLSYVTMIALSGVKFPCSEMFVACTIQIMSEFLSHPPPLDFAFGMFTTLFISYSIL